jgi:hypothetical protein
MRRKHKLDLKVVNFVATNANEVLIAPMVRYSGVCVWWEFGVRRSILFWWFWQKSGVSRREDVLILIYLVNKCYKFCTFNAISKDNAAINYITVLPRNIIVNIRHAFWTSEPFVRCRSSWSLVLSLAILTERKADNTMTGICKESGVRRSALCCVWQNSGFNLHDVFTLNFLCVSFFEHELQS